MSEPIDYARVYNVHFRNDGTSRVSVMYRGDLYNKIELTGEAAETFTKNFLAYLRRQEEAR